MKNLIKKTAFILGTGLVLLGTDYVIDYFKENKPSVEENYSGKDKKSAKNIYDFEFIED